MEMLFITNLNMFIFEFLLTRYPQITEACRARNGFSKRFVMIGIVFVIGIGYFVTGTWGQKKGALRTSGGCGVPEWFGGGTAFLQASNDRCRHRGRTRKAGSFRPCSIPASSFAGVLKW